MSLAPPPAPSPKSKQAPAVMSIFAVPNASDFSKASSLLPPPSPFKSSLSTLLASQRLESSSSALSSLAQPQPQPESTVDGNNPVIAFRIRNYAAVEDEDADRDELDDVVKPISIATSGPR
ncbi:hypothetical protein BC830DRAFT_1171960 [Chytriomyces sp. MP71]|nr:hypothetical protein BC830DRAFT_1171960 [Chytriomyces sp. MP71]